MLLEEVRSLLRKMTVEEVARGAGISRTAVMRIRDSEKFTYSTFLKVVEFLKNRGIDI